MTRRIGLFLMMVAILTPAYAERSAPIVLGVQWEQFDQTFQLGYAVAFLEGLAFDSLGTSLKTATTFSQRLGHCIRQKSISPQQMQVVIGDYLREHPEEMQHFLYQVALSALMRLCK